MRLLKKILLGSLVLLLALVAFLVISTVIDFAVGGDRIEAVTNTTIPELEGSPEVRAFVARPQGEGPFPVVIMIHEFFGSQREHRREGAGTGRRGVPCRRP